MVTGRFRALGAALAFAVSLCGLSAALGVPAAGQSTLQPRLSDQDFWKLIGDVSETNGSFRSDNLLSNEARLQYVIPDLERSLKPGGVYLGVGPEQNFTYIAALKPAMAFIIDIRRGNLDLQLLYKALFELSADRIDFVSKLFSRPRPAGLTAKSTTAEIFSAYRAAEHNEVLYRTTLRNVETHLKTKHGFTLSADDLKGIEYAYNAFYTHGPSIRYSTTDGVPSGGEPDYAGLMTATDPTGRQRAFLASDEAFAFMKDFETRNLVVPIVGDFAGPKAIRGIGRYLREKGAFVSAFYVSNVEQYLRLFRTWGTFCANTQALPSDDTSTFIRAGQGGRVSRGSTMMAELALFSTETRNCAQGR